MKLFVSVGDSHNQAEHPTNILPFGLAVAQQGIALNNNSSTDISKRRMHALNAFGQHTHIYSMTEQMMLPSSIHIWLTVFWSSISLNCFVFINHLPSQAIFTHTVFFLSPLFSCCTVAGWHGRMSGLKELTLDLLHARKNHFKSKFLFLKTKGILTVDSALDIIILTCSARVKETFCCFKTPFSLSLSLVQ